MELMKSHHNEFNLYMSQSFRQLRSVFDPQYSPVTFEDDDVIQASKMTDVKREIGDVSTHLMSNLSAGPTKYFSTANDLLIE